MVPNDMRYIKRLISDGIIRSPCLEIGAGLEDHTLKSLLQAAGIEWFGTDREATTPDVACVDFERPFDDVQKALGNKRFQTVLLLNVLEHVFDPIRVLDNACGLLNPGQHCVVVTPTVWPLHYFPLDCWRINPGLYEEYCRRRGFRLLTDYFCYVSPPDQMHRDAAGHCRLPPMATDRVRYWRSRFVHRVFGTSGRGMLFPSHVSTGAVIQVK